jgi:hypothetical protein
MLCECSSSAQERSLGIAACGDDCLNRLLMIECGSRCPCGEHCTNRNFRRRQNAAIEPFRTELKGWGLRTSPGCDLKASTFLIEYVGEVINVRQFKKRSERYAAQGNEHFYFMSLHNDLFIDATRKGNMSRFFNHSCDPNCETQKWTVNGELRIGFFTRRAVVAGEELTFDYQFQTVGKTQQRCYCGSDKCRGFLGAASGSGQQSQPSRALDHIWANTDTDTDTDSYSGSSQDSQSDIEDEEKHMDSASGSGSDSEVSEVKKTDTPAVHKGSVNAGAGVGVGVELKVKKEKKPADRMDHDLSYQINSIRTLDTHESVLKLCRLMFRTENVESRIDILNLLLVIVLFDYNSRPK